MAKAYKKRVLGRGLSAILSDDDNNRFEINKKTNLLNEIEIDKISLNPYQPRTNFNKKSLELLFSNKYPPLPFNRNSFGPFLQLDEMIFKLKELSNLIISSLRKKLGKDFPIIGVGGIMNAEDALEKIELGADLVQLYTGFIYEGPSLIKRINY